MLNSSENLSHNLFSNGVEQRALRDGYGEALLEAAHENEDVVVLTSDLKESTRSEAFARVYPERFFEIGVAEQNMAAIAAGMGVSGKIPFINSYATFSPGRNWEQIRTTICYNDSNVKIAGHHSGISVGPDGATHQSVEDLATTRVLPNMTVFAPCDSNEAHKAVLAAAKIWGPVYIRLAREKTPIMTTKETSFVPGKAIVFWKSKKKTPDVVLVATGTMVHNTMLAARTLEKEKISCVVLNMHTIKPIDEKALVLWAKKAGAVVSVEEHNILGGLGSAVSEVLSRRAPTPQEFVGIKDVFGESGTIHQLWKKYHLTEKDIVHAAKKVIRRK